MTILYGTESGNSETLADKTVKAAKKKGFKAVMKNLADISVKDILKFEHIGLIVSTWGDGDPPEAVEAFHKEFMASSADLKGVKFSVCALGDTSYDRFCQTGKEFDEQFAKLGAERVADRVDCDVDFDDAYGQWQDAFFGALGTADAPAAAPVMDLAGFGAPAVEYGRKNPFPAEVIENLVLNGEGSAKETIHLELDLEGSGLDYEAGDALGVLPVNPPEIVDEILRGLPFKPNEEVPLPKSDQEVTLREALLYHYDIRSLSKHNQLPPNMLFKDAIRKLRLGEGKHLQQIYTPSLSIH